MYLKLCKNFRAYPLIDPLTLKNRFEKALFHMIYHATH